MVGLNHEQVVTSRKGAGRPTTAALTFAKRVLDTKGQVTESDLDAVQSAGFSDGEIAEMIAGRHLQEGVYVLNAAPDKHLKQWLT